MDQYQLTMADYQSGELSQVSIATKASRCVHAAQERSLVDFSLRRAHGREVGLKVARSS